MSAACLFYFLSITCRPLIAIFFFFNDTATTEIYTLSLHDALPICLAQAGTQGQAVVEQGLRVLEVQRVHLLGLVVIDRKSTRLNSSHLVISYAVFCLKKKKKQVPSYLVAHLCTHAQSGARGRRSSC